VRVPYTVRAASSTFPIGIKRRSSDIGTAHEGVIKKATR
jgi:hypothetical protein